MDLLDRYKGTLIGGHCGDTRGGPYETWREKAIADDITQRGSSAMFDYKNTRPDDNPIDVFPAGRPTDDSDQTADLCHSLITCGGLDVNHLRDSLRRSVVYGKSRLWDGKASGVGSFAKVSLSLDPEERLPTTLYNIGTNGSLMRCAPMALWLMPSIVDFSEDRKFYPDNASTARKLVEDMSSVTHSHAHSKQACWIYTIILSSLLCGNEPDSALHDAEAIDPSIASVPLAVRIGSRLKDPDYVPYDPGNGKESTKAEFSLYVALYALLKTNSFEEGIELAIRVGGDTDTYAAIAGGLLGAHYGYDAIPQDWKDTILGHDVMVDYAEKLHDMRLYK